MTAQEVLGRRMPMSQAPATIVVVDDDSDTVAFLCDYLGSMGLHVVSCRVGQQAAAYIVQHVPTFVILDVDLGDMTGIDVFHAVRANATTRLVPVIFFTGNADEVRHALPDYQDHHATLVDKPDMVGLHAAIHDLVHE